MTPKEMEFFVKLRNLCYDYEVTLGVDYSEDLEFFFHDTNHYFYKIDDERFSAKTVTITEKQRLCTVTHFLENLFEKS